MHLSPLVSIIMPAYNQGKYIGEALDSILAQTYPNWECIIINDASTDETHEIVHPYLRDKRFKYLRNKKSGQIISKNIGINMAEGTWIQFLDSDDYIEPQKLELSLKQAYKNASLDIIVSDFKLFIDDRIKSIPAYNKLKQDYLNFEQILFGWDTCFIIPIHCYFFKATLFKENFFNENLTAYEDWVMWIKIFEKKPAAIYLDSFLAYYRINPTSITKDPVFVHNSLILAYKHIITFLPAEYLPKFSSMVIDRLDTIIQQKNHRISILTTTLPNKIIWKLKQLVNRK